MKTLEQKGEVTVDLEKNGVDVHYDDLDKAVSTLSESSAILSNANKIETNAGAAEEEEDAHDGPHGPPVFPFFSKDNKPLRNRIFKTVSFNLLLMSTLMLGVFCIYWGSMYQRGTRLVNLKVMVVLEDQDEDGQYPILSKALSECMSSPSLSTSLGWKIHNYTEISAKADSSSYSSVDAWIKNEVHKQRYWSSVYLRSSDESSKLIDSFKNISSGFNTTGSVKSYFETGRDFQAMNSYVTPSINRLSACMGSYLGSTSYPDILNNQLNSTQREALIGSAPEILTDVITIENTDPVPFTDYVLVAPSQVGLIYLVIVTFFQFMFFMDLHMSVLPHMAISKYLIYRIICSQFGFLVLSLIYSCVSAAFQVNFNNSWKGGFGIQWMVSFLTMSAVGGANENMALICFALYQPLVGFWMLLWIIINISPTFSPLALCPTFYRYGYAMPLHHSYEIMKTILFDIYKGKIGLNLGVLFAWIVINTALFPFCLMFFGYMMKKNGGGRPH